MGRRRHGAPAPSEKAIQASVVEHWRLLGLPNTLVAAIPNALAHGQPGLTRGLPDLVVLAPGLPVGFIELKRDRQAPIGDDQRQFALLCARICVRHAFAIGRDEPIAILEAWGVVRMRASNVVGSERTVDPPRGAAGVAESPERRSV
jgi:hypothetical protein